jgi:acetyl-CoA C-acetyltransferase
VIVGVAQLTQRTADLSSAAEPLAMMIDVVSRAAADASTSRLLEKLDLVAVVRGAWNYSDPGRLIADAVGARSARTALSAEGGNAPQYALNEIASRIAEGSVQAAVVVGGEGIYTRRKCREAGIERRVTRQQDVIPDENFGADYPMSSALEESRGLTAPLHFYALFENALRAERGASLAEHRDRVAHLLDRFNAVAAANPLAWSPRRLSVEQIRDVAPDNPMAAYPYTKRMCSNWFTDQAAAVLLCSSELADALGVPLDRRVFPLAGTSGSDTQFITHRASLTRSPAIAIAGRRALALAEVDIDEIDHVDIYSCFPSAVQVASRELGLADDRQLTITGGLSYFGGPLANYVTHSIASMVETLRADPGARGLVTANGGYLTKHAFGVYSTRPPARYRREDVQPKIDTVTRRPGAESHVGPVRIEASTALYRDGHPQTAVLSCLTDVGGRTFAFSRRPDVLEAATTIELAGKAAIIAADGSAAF